MVDFQNPQPTGSLDYLRIDHFRGFEAYWAVSSERRPQSTVLWKHGPKEDLFRHRKGAWKKSSDHCRRSWCHQQPEVEKLRINSIFLV
ncbi:MAG: 4-alpha-glucanotransferase [[Clostridium] nexile]